VRALLSSNSRQIRRALILSYFDFFHFQLPRFMLEQRGKEEEQGESSADWQVCTSSFSNSVCSHD
jgi:hypothetical protein